MARQPQPPSTPFGAWLTQWLAEHPDVTHQALADDLDVSKGLISQWKSGQVKRVGIGVLRRLAVRTGTPIEALERLVYGDSIEVAPNITPAVLDELEERIRRAFREELAAALAELRAPE